MSLILTVALVLTTTALSLMAAVHVVVHKRDVRAAIGWSGAILLLPVLGPLAYMLFGVNRIKRRAGRIFGPSRARSVTQWAVVRVAPRQERPRTFGADGLRRYLDGLVLTQLLEGNHVEPHATGDAAFTAMLEAIERAESSVTLATYIFDHDPTGLQFADALDAARRRGVEIRVLIDAVGARYSLRSMVLELRRRGVRVAAFNPNRVPWRFPYLNLRNHRKALIVDGRLAFTGGMNIRQGHRLEGDVPGAVQDTHFEVYGPVVGDLQRVFAEDWYHTTHEKLLGEPWFPQLELSGPVLSRVVEDGPDRNLDKLLWTVMGALACAERRVKIVNPYFLPDAGLDRALQVAARRGVEVEIVLPERNNLRLVHRASRAMWRWVLEGGCRLWLTPPPFDHSKLMIVDDHWSFVGSANLDPRSLRLNFELNLECQNPELNRRLDRIIETKKADAREFTLDDWWTRPGAEKVVDGAARLLSPYL